MLSLDNELLSFEPISLEAMDSVALLNRTDTKFLFKLSSLSSILKKVAKDYFILDIKENRVSRYKTLYYDTVDFSLYTQHHNGKQNRYKIRCREYLDSGLIVLETKFKSNQGRTIKKRLKVEQVPLKFDTRQSEFIKTNSGLDPLALEPKVWIFYKRITLVSKQMKERVTIDFDLSFEFNDKKGNFGQVAIAEVKQNRESHSPFLEVMKHEHCSDVSFSKYCLSISKLYPETKYNNFKPKLLMINRLSNEHSSNTQHRR